jgi:hypothetical protein
LSNDAQVAPNQYEFDIWITDLNDGIYYELQAAQIGLTFNTNVKNGGTLSAVYLAGTSQFLPAQVPGAPSLATMTGNPAVGVFRVAPKAALLPGEGTVLTNTSKRMGRFRISTSALFFTPGEKMNLAWNFLSTSGRYPTKIAAWVDDGVLEAIIAKDITVQASHNAALANPPLPAELTSLTASSQGRDIQLSWETKSEVNSSRFEIERTVVNTQNWTKIGEVAAAGNSNSPKEYTFTDKKLNSGSYTYRLKMVDNDGSYRYSQQVEGEVALPKEYAISQNYPNPFNPTTRIDYQLPFDSKVTLELYGVTGEKVATILNGDLGAGYYTAEVNASALNLASGVYIYRINATGQNNQNFVQVKKLMLTK